MEPVGRRLPRRFALLVLALALTGASGLLLPACGGDEAPEASAERVAATATTGGGAGSMGVSPVTVPPTSSTVPTPPPPPGTFVTAPGTSAVVGTGPLQTYSVEVETATGVDPVAFAAAVDATLADPRSWIADGSVSLQRVEAGAGTRIVLATPGTTDSMCAPLRTNGRYSCGQGGTAVINLDRWTSGIDVWTGPIEEYRHYVINHEYGHVLGHGHVSCPGAGQLDPVMAQQTKGLDGCLPNGWPYP